MIRVVLAIAMSLVLSLGTVVPASANDLGIPTGALPLTIVESGELSFQP